MSIIVDGYNYIGRSQELRLDDSSARDTLIYLMGQYCARARKTMTIVFDGNYFVHHINRRRRYGRVTVIYTSPIYTADEAIKKMVRKQDARRRKSMLVVSSDGDILQYVQSHGTMICKSEDFERQIYRTLNAPQQIDRVNVQISDEDVQKWLKIFGPESEEPCKAARRKKSSSPRVPEEQPEALSPQKPETPQPQRPKQRRSAKKRSERTSSGIDRVNVHLSQREVEEWLDIFGTEED